LHCVLLACVGSMPGADKSCRRNDNAEASIMPSIVAAVGWVPMIAGVAMTVCALAVGAAFAWRDADVRPAADVAAAMRNPGLALVIATVNQTPPAATTAVIGYALGPGVTIIALLQWRKRALTQACAARPTVPFNEVFQTNSRPTRSLTMVNADSPGLLHLPAAEELARVPGRNEGHADRSNS
jgi:hypothetical protein